MREEHKQSSGNTIVNLVIIVVILFVVAAIIYPVFTHPVGGAKKTLCQCNLKEIALAFNMYHGDYDNTLPSSYLYGRSQTWNREDFRHYASELGQIPPKGQSPTGNTWPMLLYQHMKNKDILWCPSDPQNPGYDGGFWYNLVHIERTPKPNAPVTYWYKAAFDRAWYGQGKYRAMKEGDFAYPADQVIFYEHNSWHWGDAEKGFKDGVTLNMAYIDGHVASRRIASSGFKTNNIDPAPATGEPAWFNHDNKTGKDGVGPYWDPKVYSDNLN